LTLRTFQDSKIIGARFRSARSLVPDLNRKSFCEKYGINRYTVQSWENGLHISKGKNIEIFIEALAREGVLCTAEWLIDGKGEPAKLIKEHYSLPCVEIKKSDQEGLNNDFNDHLMEKVLGLSKEMGTDILAHRVSDDAMAPKFLAGDLVLGQKMNFIREMAHQKYCIIRLNHDRLVVRKVLVTKEGLLLVAGDERVPSFLLSFGSEIYKIVWHMLSQ
jgi:hypothetical protein